MTELWIKRRALAPSICIISAASETLEAALCPSETRWRLHAPLFNSGRLPAL